MQSYFSTTELVRIEFYRLLMVQTAAYILFFWMTAQMLLLFYYLSLKGVVSQLATIGWNMIWMFGYRRFGVHSSIEATLVFVKYYHGGMSERTIVCQILGMLPVLLVLMVTSIGIVKRKDVL